MIAPAVLAALTLAFQGDIVATAPAAVSQAPTPPAATPPEIPPTSPGPVSPAPPPPSPPPAVETTPDIIMLPGRSRRPTSDRRALRVSLFISPSGEPFRGEGGLGRWFTGADANHDGALTLAEFRADAERVFKLYDANGDGAIDGFESGDYEAKIVPEIAESGLGGRRRPQARFLWFGGGTRGEDRQGAGRFGLLDEPQPLRIADADLNYRITVAEWARATDRRFADIDTAHTGRPTLATLPAVPGAPEAPPPEQ